MGPLKPLFWTSADVSSGFQSQGEEPYSGLAEAYGGVHYIIILYNMSVKKQEYQMPRVEAGFTSPTQIYSGFS